MLTAYPAAASFSLFEKSAAAADFLDLDHDWFRALDLMSSGLRPGEEGGRWEESERARKDADRSEAEYEFG